MKILKTKDVKTPNRGTSESCGIDWYVPSDFEPFHLSPGSSIMIDSGIKLILDPGYCGVFQNKSSIGSKGLITGACVIDQDFRDTVFINLWNVSNESIQINPGQKIVQMLLHKVPYLTVNEITEEEFNEDVTERIGGFGSTGAY